MLLSPVERALAGVRIPERVLILRITVAFISALLLWIGASSLFRELGLSGHYRNTALFCLFSCQMIWATIAHIANDWLALPLAALLLVAMIRYWRDPNIRSALIAAAFCSVGLLTKAYFTAFIPLILSLPAAKKRLWDFCTILACIAIFAGPWYLGNHFRYGSALATTQSRAGVGTAALVAAPSLNWPHMIWAGLRSALWTGNNSFTSFSVVTLAAIAVFWAVALILWLPTKHTGQERIVALYCGLFVLALGYDAAVESIYVHSSVGPAPWYAQALVVPMLGLAFLGCARSKPAGRLICRPLTALLGYVLTATYALKLIPLYGGYAGRASLGSLIPVYTSGLPSLIDNLNLVALAPAWLLLTLTALVAVLAVTQMVVLIRSVN